jgi:hypothetical protein
MRRRDLLASPGALFAVAGENRKAGTDDWQLTYPWPNEKGGLRSSLIEGYCRRQSIQAGESIEVCVSTRPARQFTLDLFRMGYYGGKGARLMQSIEPLQGKPQPDPPIGDRRLRECRWETSLEIKIAKDWPSGVYLGKLSTLPSKNEHPWQNYIIFVVRDQRKADILFQVSDNTWQAYNKWPDNWSLYTDPRHSWASGVAVSFDRPYGKYPQVVEQPLSLGSGEFLLWEFPLAYWLEQQGYDVTYASNSDMLDVNEFTRAKVFLSVGHDEYWDVRQYNAALESVRQGVTHLYLSGNSIMGVTPFRTSSDGRSKRVISREGVYGGVYGRFPEFFKTDFPSHGPSANLLMGAHSVYPPNGGGDWICTKPEHWIFAGTGMQHGEHIPGLVGWEFHGDPAPIAGLEVVAQGTALSSGIAPSDWTATIYPGPHGNFVFNAATIYWAQGLSAPPGHVLPFSHWARPHGPDVRVQKITTNLLRRALRNRTR